MSSRGWISTAKSHVGCIRAVNEDAFLNEPGAGLWCVADGMGGHSKGDVASALIVDKLAALADNPETLSVDTISLAIQEANTEIMTLSKSAGAKVGSTVAVLFIKQEIANILWAGDSRVYHFSDGKISRVTRDHSQAEELVMHGFLTPEQAQKHPGSNLITRAVGTRDTLSLEHKAVYWQTTDTFIVCTDGLNSALDDADIEAQLLNTEPHDLSDSLIDKALKSWALDNVTVVAVHGAPEV